MPNNLYETIYQKPIKIEETFVNNLMNNLSDEQKSIFKKEMNTINKKTILVDFDGVIHKYSKGWYDGSIYDEPIEGAKESMEKLMEKYEVVIFTTRVNTNPFFNTDRAKENYALYTPIKEWLKKYGFELNIHYSGITYEKLAAVAIIDDRAINFTNWDQDEINKLTI